METMNDLFFKLLRCPACSSQLELKIYEWDNISKNPLTGILLCSCGMWYPINKGIPRIFLSGALRPNDVEFAKKWLIEPLDMQIQDEHFEEDSCSQVQKTFGHKWVKQQWWGMEGNTAAFMESWVLPRYGWRDKESYEDFFKDKKVAVDAGCGLGREALRMAKANKNMMVIGIELSECVDKAREHAKKQGLNNVFYIQADINHLPFAEKSVDFAISEGVLHHTPDTHSAFVSVAKSIKVGGEFGFYIYRKKAPLREFADDYIRDKISELQPEEAWRQLESLTRLGKKLHELNVSISIDEDIPLLEIQAGKYDLQRLIYYHMFKCFWNPNWTFDENVHINFDWYTPKYSWRHTEEEVHDWLKTLSFVTVNEHVEESGITIRGKKSEYNSLG